MSQDSSTGVTSKNEDPIKTVTTNVDNNTNDPAVAMKTGIERLIYAGPAVPKEGLKRFTVFKGGVPSNFNTVIEKCPEIKKMFVEPEKFADILLEIEQTGTAYHTWYAKIANYVKGV